MNVLSELRVAFRRLCQRPMTFFIAVVTLTLSMGIGTTIFTFVNYLLLRPLPVDRPTQVVSIQPNRGVSFSFPNYLDIRDRNDVFTGVAAMRIAMANLSQGNQATRVWGYLVT